MIDIEGLFSSLLTATIGGVPFNVVDSSQEIGRRTIEFLWPGIDDSGWQDIGLSDGPISLRGILIGDDYIMQMKALRAVFRSPGPWTLVHPWYGTLRVLQAPGQRPRITLAANELRVARFEVQLREFNPAADAGLDTLTQLDAAYHALVADASNWLAAAMSPAVNVLGAFSFVQGMLSGIAQSFTAAIATTSSSGAIGAAAAPAIATLATPTTAPGAGWATATAAEMLAVPAAIAGAAAPTVPSAVAPGGTATPALPADPADAASTLLNAVPGITAAGGANAPGPALAAAMQAATVGAAVQAASGITYASQQDAERQAAVLYAALDAATAAAALAAQGDPANAAPVWRDLIALKATLAADLNSLIGRLPPVVIINIPVAMPAWVIAHYISGDTPDEVYGTYQDIIARNKVFNPALVPAGPLEVLDV